MTEDEYIKDRLENQIDWYDKKSQWNQKWYKKLRMIELIAASSIPFFVAFISDSKPAFTVIVGFLGVVVAVISGIIALYKFQEIWTEYRVTCETLRHEKVLFQTKCKPYDIGKPFPLLVNRVEAIFRGERSKWEEHISVKPGKKEDGKSE